MNSTNENTRVKGRKSAVDQMTSEIAEYITTIEQKNVQGLHPEGVS